ncbi:wolframin-like isoform X1 [Prorops nasuta]|uniref:wolframin-like isoform X1 n=1 Tax=Prorops nasuta TaxID=863751 RepID=UPI0034CDD9D8
MAGIVPVSGRTGRKQWTLRDGQPLKRYCFAEDGSPESQVYMAKQLLGEKCELDVDKENAELGVYWLTKASEQGNLEATELLHKCLKNGCGISERNYYDVKTCLDMPQSEKLARTAARKMFLSLSNGEDFITTEQLQRRMRDIASPLMSAEDSNSTSFPSTSNDTEKELNEEVNRELPKNGFLDENKSIRNEDEKTSNINHDWSDYQGEKITEAALVSAASSYAQGMLPIMSRALCMVEPSQIALDAIPLLQRPFVHPFASLKRLYFWFIGTIGQKSAPLKKLFTSNLYILLLLLLYSLLGTESLVLFIPMAFYYLSFIVMVTSTCQMLQKKRELNNFRVWSGLFLSYSGGNLNPDEAEYQFCRNNLKPYAHFFLALLLNQMIYPIIIHQWTPQSEFTVIAVALTFLTLFNFVGRESSKFADFLALFSFGVHVLAKYPYETDIVVAQSWRFLDIRVPTFASYVVGNSIEFCLNFRAVFYLLIPAVFAKMAARDNWRGTYRTLIPHCVTLSWWQIAIFSSQGATWYGLIRGALALVGMVLFLPIAGLASIVLPIVAIARYLSESDLAMRILITILIGGLPFITSWYLKRSRISRFNWIITIIQLLLGISAGVFLSWPMIIDYKQSNIDTYNTVPALSWEQYQNYCHQPAWDELSSKAQVQMRCAQLDGVPVSWEGYVTSVRLKSISNNIASILNKLPESVKSSLSCAFGEPYEESCSKGSEIHKKNCKHLISIQKTKQKCSLTAWDKYEFEVSVKMKNGIWGNNAEIILIADHSFKNFSLSIYPSDKIWFSGSLVNLGEGESLLGGWKPHIDLEEVQCIVCHSINQKSYKRYRYEITVGSIIRVVCLGVKTVLNFLLNPIVMFK